MGKRKRPVQDSASIETSKISKIDAKDAVTNSKRPSSGSAAHFQIIAGSYDRTLHGIIATVNPKNENNKKAQVSAVSFHDNFLFSAHSSAIRCLAVSPQATSTSHSTGKITLATGGTDERVNLYQLDTSIPSGASSIVSLSGKTLENPKNKELGSLLHHSSSINALHFVSRGKLLSAAGDNTVAITRTRDWTVLSTIKAPVPRVSGRPSGDTAGPGEVPMGVNDFAVHPSRKLMISVGKGEKCMRLWNLVTGKKAGVLNFEKDLLIAVGEGRWSRGEGLKVEWNTQGDEFAVAFERGVAVFSMDSEPKGVIRPVPASKVHQIRYFRDEQDQRDLLAVSTEDGRLLFYSTNPAPETASEGIPALQAIGQLGGEDIAPRSRIKDFEILPYGETGEYLVITASSDGSIRLWTLRSDELHDKSVNGESTAKAKAKPATNGDVTVRNGDAAPQVGTLLDVYSTNSRVTCLRVFEMGQPGKAVPVNGTRAGAEEVSESEDGAEDGDAPEGELEHAEPDDLDGGSEDGSGDDFEGFD